MSVKKSLSLNNCKAAVTVGDSVGNHAVASKRTRFDRCFSFVEVPIEPGKSLKHLDSKKFKIDIRRWAKRVVAYARQVSGRISSGGGNSLFFSDSDKSTGFMVGT
ncbi:hypothetical protein Tsubulata_027686 [Turnera subulata]|uniref:Uncharacterized protein n=1 Tax=Turnera subulata TaxID=218843 RepID=A0A9Q0F425_9ROSI|nr:hypothetical protein Tsubulata_027686 [Turnera subulata]